jgi:hypothetical protein
MRRKPRAGSAIGHSQAGNHAARPSSLPSSRPLTSRCSESSSGWCSAFLVTRSLGDLGLGFSIPGGQRLVCLLLTMIVGIVAAIVPARRGARLQVLEAMRAE